MGALTWIASGLTDFLRILWFNLHKNTESSLDKEVDPIRDSVPIWGHRNRDDASRGVERVMSDDYELPWSPPKRGQRPEQQFSSFLAFVKPATKTGRYLSRWSVEKSWAEDCRTLSVAHPDWEVANWLAYFVDCLTRKALSPSKQQLALHHLWCFYQEDCYYLSRKWWMDRKLPRHLFSWPEIFDVVCEPLTDLAKARRSLQNFDPHCSYRKYIKQLLYHRSRDAFYRKLGPSHWQKPPVIYSLEQADAESPKERSQPDLQEFEREKAHQEQKAQQDQVYKIVEQRLKQLKLDRNPGKRAPIPPTTLTLWEMMLMGYGLNIGQSGTVQILEYNRQPLQQSKLSRQLQTFKVELFLACLLPFAQEIQDQLGDRLAEKQPEQDADFKNLAQKQHKSLDPLLKQYYQDWIFKFVLKEGFDPISASALDLWLISQLQAWFKTQLEIIFELEAFTPAVIKKMRQVLQAWEAELRA